MPVKCRDGRKEEIAGGEREVAGGVNSGVGAYTVRGRNETKGTTKQAAYKRNSCNSSFFLELPTMAWAIVLALSSSSSCNQTSIYA